MTFQVGEKVVYPNHGVATIENISSRAFAGHFERFYLLRLTYNSLTVMVPFSHVEELRLRKLTRNNEVARVISFLSEGRCRHYQDWKDRFKENTERMRDGSLVGSRRSAEEPVDPANAEAALFPGEEDAGPRPAYAGGRVLYFAADERGRSGTVAGPGAGEGETTFAGTALTPAPRGASC